MNKVLRENDILCKTIHHLKLRCFKFNYLASPISVDFRATSQLIIVNEINLNHACTLQNYASVKCDLHLQPVTDRENNNVCTKAGGV